MVGNAVKFTKEGRVLIRILLLRQEGSKVDIERCIEDTGIGIPKDEQERIFEAFTQKEGQDNRSYGGTGLGLSIVKGLVDILKGKIYLKSELGKGTSFFIELPLKESEEVVSVKKHDYSKDISKLDLENVKI